MSDPELQDEWLERLFRLNAVIASAGEPLDGNLFYVHQDAGFADSPPDPRHRAKRDRFRAAVDGRRRLLEVGVNGGHSALLALSENPTLEFHGVDICEHAYVKPAVAWLENEFPGRVFFYPGDCLTVLPSLVRRRLSCDVFHVDGAKHTYYDDIVNCSRMASAGSLVIVDDLQYPGPANAWRWCLRHGVVVRSDEFPTMDSSVRSSNGIGRLVPSSWVKWVALRNFSRALTLRRHAYAVLGRRRGRS
jgi:hypothetical protein